VPSVYENCASVSLVGAQIRGALASVAPALTIFRNFKVHMMTQAANDLNLTFVVDDEHAEPIAKELHSLYSRTVNSPRTFGRTWSSLALADQMSLRTHCDMQYEWRLSDETHTLFGGNFHANFVMANRKFDILRPIVHFTPSEHTRREGHMVTTIY
jgi:hypothetical protein